MVYESTHTSKVGTETRQGFIYHQKTESGVRPPVKLDFNSEKIDNIYFPLRKRGRLVFALPGGGEILEPKFR